MMLARYTHDGRTAGNGSPRAEPGMSDEKLSHLSAYDRRVSVLYPGNVPQRGAPVTVHCLLTALRTSRSSG